MIKLVNDTIDKEDISELVKWLSQEQIPILTKNQLTLELEKKWSSKINTKYSVYLNSGSSAILLTLAALIQSGKLKNKKIVVPSLSWATDISSPILLNMEPILCDCNLTDLSCDLTSLENMFNEHEPSCFILVSPLGLVPNMQKIMELCKKYDVLLLEDVCESMGSKFNGQYLGSFGFASFFSMYFGHHLSTIEGGFINTNDEEFYYLLLMMRSHGWDRDLPKKKQEQLRTKYQVTDFESLYNFYVPGFNLRATDLQAFIGLRAIEKLDNYSQIRNNNFKLYNELLSYNELKLDDFKSNFISNFAYPFMSKNKVSIVKNLQKNEIEVRPLIAGDMSQKPMWFEKFGHQILKNSRLIHEFGFYIPNHQKLTVGEINFICSIINNS
jgi:CDP-6-deoxy-D-xylo-4-hexulose-3-dehydrase